MSAVHFSFQTLVEQKLSRLLAVVFFLLITSTLHAQIVETGIITGIVKDGTGAVIPNAQVTVLNASTGLRSNTSSDAQGIYVSPPLHPGDYNVVVEAPGFSKVVVGTRGVHLDDLVDIYAGSRSHPRPLLLLRGSGEIPDAISFKARAQIMWISPSSRILT